MSKDYFEIKIPSIKKIIIILIIILLIISNIYLYHLYHLKKIESQSNYENWKNFENKYNIKTEESQSNYENWQNSLIEINNLSNEIYNLNNELNNQIYFTNYYSDQIDEIEQENAAEEERLKNTYDSKEIIEGITLSINKWDYTQYRNKERYSTSNWVNMIYESENDDYIEDLNKQIKKKYDDEGNDLIYDLIEFVQDFSYYQDITTGLNEYPKYPIETLYDGGGDCEDTSILLATLIYHNNYGAVLINLPGHMAIGIKCDIDSFSRSITYYQYNNENYCYVETTGKNWQIGQMPEEYKGKEATLYYI